MTSQPNSLYWSVRREVWENRSIYLAPLVVTFVVLFGTFVGTMTLPHRLRKTTDPAKQRSAIVAPAATAPAPIMFATFLVGIFYSIDALYSERRDRSILFWKSLPVSDRMTVISKAMIPLAVLPLIGLILGVITQFLVQMLSTMVLLGSGRSPATLWSALPLHQEIFVSTYGLTVHALWFAPVYAYLMLVSAWARRAPLLWALLPPMAAVMLERMMFGTTFFGSMLKYRFAGGMQEAFASGAHASIIRLSQLQPLRFVTSAGLWVGLLFAVLCFACAVRLRRLREPI